MPGLIDRTNYILRTDIVLLWTFFLRVPFVSADVAAIARCSHDDRNGRCELVRKASSQQ